MKFCYQCKQQKRFGSWSIGYYILGKKGKWKCKKCRNSNNKEFIERLHLEKEQSREKFNKQYIDYIDQNIEDFRKLVMQELTEENILIKSEHVFGKKINKVVNWRDGRPYKYQMSPYWEWNRDFNSGQVKCKNCNISRNSAVFRNKFECKNKEILLNVENNEKLR